MLQGKLFLAQADFDTVQLDQEFRNFLLEVYHRTVSNRIVGPPSSAAFNEFGNAQNNTERGPNSKIIDLSLFKAFQTFREQTIKFRADAFNAFNIVNYGLPPSRVGKSTFGLINATSTGTTHRGSFSCRWSTSFNGPQTAFEKACCR